MSPCARRVRMTLLAKGIPWTKVNLDLLLGEQKRPEYLAINPQGKVPAITFRNVKGVGDISLHESNVITEFIDTSVEGACKLYPLDLWEETQARMWMDWEHAMQEDYRATMYCNVVPFAIRMKFSTKEAYLASQGSHLSEAQQNHFLGLYEGSSRESEDDYHCHVRVCYRSLRQVELALDGKDYLVGNRLTIADLSVYPRVAMSPQAQMPILPNDFPNVYRYMRRLEKLEVFSRSQPTAMRLQSYVLPHVLWLMAGIGNWRHRDNPLTVYHGHKQLARVLGEAALCRPMAKPLPDITDEELVLFHYSAAPECWQLQLMLKEMGRRYSLKECDVMEYVGRPQGAEGVLRLQHGQRLVTGPRAMFHYLSATFPQAALLPTDPQLRSSVQCWMAWEQNVGSTHLYPLLETTLLPNLIRNRCSGGVGDLLKVRSDPFLNVRYSTLVRVYATRLPPESEEFGGLMEELPTLGKDVSAMRGRAVTLENDLKAALRHLDTSLQDRQYLVGDSLTLADIAVFCRVMMMSLVGVDVNVTSFPDAYKWLRLVGSRPNFGRITNEMKTTLGKYVRH